MPQVIRNGEQELKDFSGLMELVPRNINMLERMGVFNVDYGSTTTAEFERRLAGRDEMYSQARGADRDVAGDDTAISAFFKIPFSTLDKVVKPNEIQDLREFATAEDPETVQGKVEKIIKRIQRSHARLHTKAMYACLAGSTYAKDKAGADRPSYVKTYQSAWEIADADMYNGAPLGAKTVTLVDPAINPTDEFELFRQHIVANAGDEGDDYEIAVLMGSGAFTALKNHPDFEAAYASFASEINPLRERLGGLKNNRVLEWQGVTYIEDLSGEIGNDKGFAFPLGMEMFELQYAPADTNEHANTTAEEAYLFVEEERRKTVIESETSFVCANNRPELVASYTFTIVAP